MKRIILGIAMVVIPVIAHFIYMVLTEPTLALGMLLIVLYCGITMGLIIWGAKT